jgi:HAE1 family hydrophobic/amphiphilic exporter-1
MNLALLSIKRPIFVTCLVILMLAMGYLSFRKLPVDLFPNVSFPIVTVQTIYLGAGPEEIETLVSKVIEEEMSTLPGIKTLRSMNNEGVSTVIAEFSLETDVKYAEQQVRDRVSSVKRKLPEDVEEPTIRRIDPADQPIVALGLTADLAEGELFELADKVIRPQIEQINQVGLVEIEGGRKREIRVELDRKKLKEFEVSATQVSSRIGAAGKNIPAGKVDEGKNETVFRTLGEFRNTADLEKTIVNFIGNDVPVTVKDVGQVYDGLEDERSRAFLNGQKSLFLSIFRQSGANTIAVTDGVKSRVSKINEMLKNQKGSPKVTLIRDGSKPINANVDDVKESILIGIILTILVVYFFLASGKSTLITGLALPNSLIGAFMLMALAGFSINVMTLLALSLSVGLLIDDAIVVRENIYRHNEMGKDPVTAALDGTREVTLAVIATTLAVVAVFGPIAFLQGVVGQFFKEFGLTICFAMAISLFDALTVAPMMSAYFAGGAHTKPGQGTSLWARTVGRLVAGFDRFQDRLEDLYGSVLVWTLKRPLRVIVGAAAIFFASIGAMLAVPKTFLPAQDVGEFMVSLEMPPGTSLPAMSEIARKVDEKIRSNPEVAVSQLTVGSTKGGGANVASFFVNLVPSKQRTINTIDFKERVRAQLKEFAEAKPIVKDYDMVAAGQRPFNVNIVGNDLATIEKIAHQLFDKVKDHPALKDVELSHKPGKPEFQVVLDNRRAEQLGVSTAVVGSELRTQIEGATPAVFREKGEEYDIRVRVAEDQRNLRSAFQTAYVPNVNMTLIRLSDIAKPVTTTGPASINRQDRGRYIQIAADVAPNGPGMGAAMTDISRILEQEIKLPEGVRYAYVGQAENFKELGQNMVMAATLGILFIFLVLASLYESFITPLTIMLVLPLAACGAFFALLITGKSLDIFSMIGCIMLLGIATKNSILLVDYTAQLTAEGRSMKDAIIEAGKTRLRPILMTTVALIAGMLPIAIGLNEASKQRTSMGVAVIGGLISSTLLTLVVVPAAYSFIERFRVWSGGLVHRLVHGKAKAASEAKSNAEPSGATKAHA